MQMHSTALAPHEELAILGEAVYGGYWRDQVKARFGITDRVFRRMLAGKDWISEDLLDELHERSGEEGRNAIRHAIEVMAALDMILPQFEGRGARPWLVKAASRVWAAR
jgi:hypothetical protein